MSEAGAPARVRVGVVGAGIAGAFSSHFLRERLGPEAEIRVFEREPRVGGRVAELSVGGARVELGATLIHSANRLMVDAVRRLGLHERSSGERRSGADGAAAAAGAPSVRGPHADHPGIVEPEAGTGLVPGGEGYAPGGRAAGAATLASEPRLAIWNGSAFDLDVPGRGLTSALAILMRYRGSLLRARRLTGDMVRKLDQVYADLAGGRAFETPEAMLRRLGLYELTQVEAARHFRAHGLSDRFIGELSDGVGRANYNQGSRMNAFVTLVSLAGGGLGGGYLFSVAEGNARVPEGLLDRAGVRLQKGVAVRAVRATTGPEAPAGSSAAAGRYVIETPDGEEGPFHAVVLATPLELSGIELRVDGLPEAASVRREYCVTHTTVVVGRARLGYFGVPEGGGRLDYLVLTRDDPAIPFSAFARVGRTPDGRGIYKFFSRAQLTEEFLDALFTRRDETLRHIWRAYPMLEPSSVWPPFRLAPGLYYANAMESAVSTMETEAMAGCNVALLAASELGGLAGRGGGR